MTEQQYDAVIVGAGFGGIGTAIQLKRLGFENFVLLDRLDDLGGTWYELKAKPGSFPASDPVRGLDVSILQENLLNPILGIDDPRTNTRIDFVGGIRGMDELERRVKEGCAVAFAVHPTSLTQLMSVADAGEVMPPKSTWFEPKLRSGLLVRMYEG